MAVLLKLVPGVKWSTRCDEDPQGVVRNFVVVTLPKTHSDKLLNQWKTSEGRKAPQTILIPDAKYEAAKASDSALRIYRSQPTHRDFWAYKRKVYVTSDRALKPADVVALINEAANRRRLQLEKAHALQSMTRQLDSKAKREPIPQEVKIAVWQRDGGRCVECGSNKSLEFDHIIPLALGGANTLRNVQLLCEVCNRRKGASLG